MNEIDILQARCDRFRNILIEIGFVKLENIEEFLAAGKLTANDVRYLYGLEPMEFTHEQFMEIGKATAEGLRDGYQDGSFAVNVVKEVRDDKN